MRNIKLCLAMLCLFLIFTQASAATLTIVVNNITLQKGVIRVALYNSATAYNDSNNLSSDIYRSAIGEINAKGESIIRLSHLPYGEYAIKLYQDEDNSGKMKTGWFGIPQEGYGFSNNVSPDHRAPDYEKVKFIFSIKNQQQVISLQHYK